MKNNIFMAISLLAMHIPKITTIEYSQLEHNYCINNNQPTVITIVAYNRPEYLAKCIKSLEENPESQSMPFIFALDGGPNSKQVENLEIIQKSKIKNKTCLIREYNYGCPKNHIDAKRFVFDWCNAERAIILEDDIVVTPNYIKFLLNLDNWARSRYKNIGAVQAWSYCYMPKETKLNYIDMVGEGSYWWSFVTYCISKEAWNQIKPIHYQYEKFIDLIPIDQGKARSKPHNSDIIGDIRTWIKSIIDTRPPRKNSLNCIKSSIRDLRPYFYSNKFKAPQDNIMGFSFWYHNLIKINTIVNRAIHIGQSGITTSPKQFKATYLKIKLEKALYANDHLIKNFKLISREF